MLNIRMRASRGGMKGRCAGGAVRQEHISGAEGLYDEAEAGRVVEDYVRRAMEHSRGRPDRIDIAIERMTERPKQIRALPVRTVRCASSRTAQSHIRKLLAAAGISEKAVNKGLEVVFGGDAMRGAAVILAASGRRADSDRRRGVRASRLGISKTAAVLLGRKLRKKNIYTPTVVEALVLSSKVASCPQVLAELCVSDDPDYTTGYVSTRGLGYVRVPHIKRKGERIGGRVFFVDDVSDMKDVTSYLEKKPVMVERISECRGVCSIDEVIGKHHI